MMCYNVEKGGISHDKFEEKHRPLYELKRDKNV